MAQIILRDGSFKETSVSKMKAAAGNRKPHKGIVGNDDGAYFTEGLQSCKRLNSLFAIFL